MKLFILGICGTFMAGIAALAKAEGHDVVGCDEHVYPPMDLWLRDQGIPVHLGYKAEHLPENVDQVIVGNVISRGNPLLEAIMARGLRMFPLLSGSAIRFLSHRKVIAVTGTHGKTTTTSLLAWIFEVAGLSPGFLIGGIAENFGLSARLGKEPYFIIEADEYDSAFFDKRPKFLHVRPTMCVLNNLEFDHADIYPDLAAIQKQFSLLLKNNSSERSVRCQRRRTCASRGFRSRRLDPCRAFWS